MMKKNTLSKTSRLFIVLLAVLFSGLLIHPSWTSASQIGRPFLFDKVETFIIGGVDRPMYVEPITFTAPTTWTGAIVNPYYELLTGPETDWLDWEAHTTLAPLVVGNGEDWLIWHQTTLVDGFRWIIVEGPVGVDGFPLDIKTLDVGSYDRTAAVPEPATMLLLGSGLIGLAGLRRKFKK
ncbi:MAG: PEP-CTERM sorting domain-containing protein [Thermodesulfobacteriota bacterium]|jgi:hypothetical protein